MHVPMRSDGETRSAETYIVLLFDPRRNDLSSGNSPISPFFASRRFFLAVSHLYLTIFNVFQTKSMR